MVVRMRHTKSHSANRRSHHALTRRALATTAEGTVHPRHRVLLEGGTYRGRTLIDRTSSRKAKVASAAKSKKAPGEEKGE